MDLFGVIWLAIVAFFAFWQASWGLRALRTGIATYYFRWEFHRDSQPFTFWMLTLSRAVGFLVAIGLFVLGLKVFGDF